MARPTDPCEHSEIEGACPLCTAAAPVQLGTPQTCKCTHDKSLHPRGHCAVALCECTDFEPVAPSQDEAKKPIDKLLNMIRTWIESESGPTHMAISHPELKTRITIRGYRKIILERTFNE